MASRSLPLVGATPRPVAREYWTVGTRCNASCPDCRRSERAPEARPEATARIVVRGGEPMLDAHWLAPLHAARIPWELETNGSLLYAPANARRLRAAGAVGVRLFLPGWDEASTDARAALPGLGAAQARAAGEVLAAGLELAFVVPVSEATGPELERYLARAEALAHARPRDTPLEITLAWQLAPAAEPSPALELALGRLALAGLRHSCVVHFDEPLAPAPCAFRRPEAFASLFPPRPPEARLPAACAPCVLAPRCAGPAPGDEPHALAPGDRHPEAWRAAVTTLLHGDDVLDWVRVDGARRRWGRENFVSIGSEHDLASGRSVRSALIRPIFHCNEDCTFCWVDLSQASVPDAAVTQALALTALEGMEAVAITGGEPTLDPRLADQVRLARALGAHQVTLQTNAVRLDKIERARALVAAGLTRAFVALHGHDAATSDAVTRRAHTFERTLVGARNLLDLGVSVGIGVVFTHANRHAARALVELVATRLRGADLTLSVASPVNDRLDMKSLTPRYSELAPTLREAARTAHALGLPYSGLYGQCGLPPCILDADPVCFPELARPHPDWSAADDFVHAPACEGCGLRRKCPGVRRRYADTYGTSELRPVP